ncbi:pyridoxamine 5'-phosphate oxidase family protein [Nonomuraea sp. N2-4H]|uniref:pyridoxamine 5'-phosphate oxidase family protein n=1 Tax=Nonomuraea sp. N2-4H TaxID=3128898 RepID=UPI00324FE56E
MFHPGEQIVQRRAGLTVGGWGSAGVGASIPQVAADFLARQRLLVIVAADETGAAWAGALTGPPGFVTAPDDRTVIADRLPGAGDPLDGLFRTERPVGVLAIDPATRRRMRVNGHARDDGGRLVIRTEQVYSNCPKYIQTRDATDEALPERGPAQVTGELTAEQQRRIAAADTFFIGTYAQGLGADASHRGGNPGFVTVTGSRTLTWPDYAGNAMYMTLGNLELEPRCGLLFLGWDDGHALHLTGRARVDWDPERAASVPGAQRLIDFEVDQAIEVSGAIPQRWSFGGYSRFNPA